MKHKSKTKHSEVKSVVLAICGGIAVTSVFLCFFMLSTVNGYSMNDTLQEGDKILVSRRGYTPQRGDIIVCSCQSLGIDLIKRVIAVSGDEVNIDFENGAVYINGELLSEDYIKEPTTLDEEGFTYPVTVPEHCVFVMGDNRNHSTDSRDERVGFVSEDNIKGKVILRYSPIAEFSTF